MSKSTRRLGRGLDSLISDLQVTTTLEATGQQRLDSQTTTGPAGAATDAVTATMLDVDSLKTNPFQPRDNINEDAVLSLARSIERAGLLQPIVARAVSGGHEIIAGERRWLAAKSLGMTHIPAIIRGATDEQMLEFALIENIQREDLNAIDRAKAYRQFCSRFSLKPEEVAARLSEDRTTVVNYLRLLDLPESIQTCVSEGKLGMGHARCLLGVADPAQRQRLAESAVHNQLSVRALEEIVRREKTRQGGPQPPAPEKKHPRSIHLTDLQRRFEEAVKTKVLIHEGKRKGSGRIVIEYYSLDDFDRIAAMLGVTPQ